MSKNSQMYVALLRGINVGGNKKVPMADLSSLLRKAGYNDVKTLLNSGNVVFEYTEHDEAQIAENLAELIQKKFGFAVPVLVRTVDDLNKLIEAEPFRSAPQGKDIQLYVTFLPEMSSKPPQLPHDSPDGFVHLVSITNKTACWWINKNEFHTVDAMKFIEQEFGKTVTTRNWNTVEKIAALGKR